MGQLRYFPIVQALPLIFLTPALSLNQPYKQTLPIHKFFSFFLIITFLNLSALIIGSSYNYVDKFHSYINFVSDLKSREAMDIRFGAWDYYKFDLEKRNIIFLKNDQLNTKCDSIRGYFNVAISDEINVCFPPD